MAIRETIEETHIVPVDDCIEHEESNFCECQPVWDEENRKDYLEGKANKMVWVHNRIKDGLH